MNADRLLSHYERIADAPDAISRLRRFVLDLAVRGKLVPQDPNDEPASELLKRIAAEKARLVKGGMIRKEKQLPEIKPEEAPFDLPLGWVWSRQGFATIIVQGFAFSSGDFSGDPSAAYPLIKIGDIGSNRPETYVKGKADPAYLVNPGDILLGLSGSIKCSVWSGPPALLNQRIARIAPPSHHIRTIWLLFVLHACIEKWKEETSKLTVQNVKATQLYEAVIPLPPLAEQRRIIAKVDELMALCDRLEAARAAREATRDKLTAASLARLNAPDPATFRDDACFALDALAALTARTDQIEQLRQTILNLAVRGKLVPQDPNEEPAAELLKRIVAEKAHRVSQGALRGPKPLPPIKEEEIEFDLSAGWQWVRMADVIKLWNGFAFKSSDFQSNGIALIRIGDLQDGEVTLSNAVYVSDAVARTVSPEVWIPPDALLIAMSGATTGKTAFNRTGLPLLLNQRVGRIEVFLISVNFIRYFFETIVARNLSISFGTAIPNLSAQQINETVFPLPPLAEQHRIVAKVDELMALCNRLEASFSTDADIRRRLLDVLLAEALAPAERARLAAAE
jgi:type I restriction enzyme S subunit